MSVDRGVDEFRNSLRPSPWSDDDDDEIAIIHSNPTDTIQVCNIIWD